MGRKSKRAVAEGRLTSEGQTVMSQQAVFLKSVKSASAHKGNEESLYLARKKELDVLPKWTI